MKSFRVTAVGTLLALGLTACGSGGTDTAESTATEGEGTAVRLWINGSDTPQAARDYLTETFEAENPGATLEIEEQQWEGLVEKLTTSLSSETETPDVVEVGNTQASTFTAVGAFTDLTDQLEEFGGDDLLPGFVEAGTYEGATYAVPYYAGSRVVFYRKDLFQAAGVAVPTTLDEFVQAAVALKAANPQPANFSGFWLPGQDWRNAVALVWANGGDIASTDGETWTGELSSPESQVGLAQAQQLFQQASGAGRDANEAEPQVPFCNGEAAMLSAPGWVRGVMEDPELGCPEVMPNVGAFALPGVDGGAAPVFLGGSNIAVSAASQNQEEAISLVGIMLSEEYQTIMGEGGLTPARVSLAGLIGDDEYAQAAITAASEAKLTPAAPGWATVEGSRTMEDLYVGLANGGDPVALAEAADADIEAALAG